MILADDTPAGAQLRAAALRIAQAVPESNKNVTLYADVVPQYDPSYEAKPDTVPLLLVEFGKACTTFNISAQRATALLGSFEQGDREFQLPAELVTEEQLRTANAYIQFGEGDLVEYFTVEKVGPTRDGVNFGVVATWLVIGRLKGKAVPVS